MTKTEALVLIDIIRDNMDDLCSCTKPNLDWPKYADAIDNAVNELESHLKSK